MKAPGKPSSIIQMPDELCWLRTFCMPVLPRPFGYMGLLSSQPGKEHIAVTIWHLRKFRSQEVSFPRVTCQTTFGLRTGIFYQPSSLCLASCLAHIGFLYLSNGWIKSYRLAKGEVKFENRSEFKALLPSPAPSIITFIGLSTLKLNYMKVPFSWVTKSQRAAVLYGLTLTRYDKHCVRGWMHIISHSHPWNPVIPVLHIRKPRLRKAETQPRVTTAVESSQSVSPQDPCSFHNSALPPKILLLHDR